MKNTNYIYNIRSHIKNDNIIPFPNGNFVTERVYYNNSKGEYKVLQDSAVIDEKYIETSKDYTQ